VKATKTPAERLEKERARYQAEKERIKGVTAAYREANRELLKEKARAYRAANRDAVKQQKAQRYLATKDDCNARSKAYYEQNKGRAAEAHKEWCARNPERARSIRANRRKTLETSGPGLSPGIAKRLYELQRGRCACCGVPLKAGYHIDHIMPLSLGGAHADTNVQLLTPRCNLRKKAMHPIDWAQRNGRLL